MDHQEETDYGDRKEEGEPYFDPDTNLNITIVVGAVARLKCSVHNLGDKTVSGRLVQRVSLTTCFFSLLNPRGSFLGRMCLIKLVEALA